MMSPKHNSEAKKFYILSGIVQLLMVYPVIFGDLMMVTQGSEEYMGAPFETRTGLLVPTLLAFALYCVNNKRQHWNFKEIKFPFIVITLAFVYSYLNPYNLAPYATTLALVVFCQILIVILAIKFTMTADETFKAIYDGYTFFILVELVVSVTYVLGIDFLQSYFTPDLKDIEYVRDGMGIRRAYGTTIQPNRLGGLCGFIFVFFYSCLLCKYQKNKSKILSVISFFVLMLSQSRSAIMATFVASLILYFTIGYKQKRINKRSIFLWGFIGGVFLITILGIIIFQGFQKSDTDEQVDNRLIHYAMGFVTLQETKYLGVGLNSHVFYLYENFKGISTTDIGFFFTRAIHSFHLCILVEVGICGFLLWLYYAFSRIFKFLVAPLFKMGNPAICLSFAGMLIMIIVHGFSDNLYFHYQQMTLLMLFGSLAVLGRDYSRVVAIS